LNPWPIILAAVLCAGCGSAIRLPPLDLAQPGWRTQQGQAVWQPPGHRPQMAGELLMATNASGDFFVQFSKPPFTVATAQASGGRWQIQFGANNYHKRGRGAPPEDFAWLELPRALRGMPAGSHWKFERLSGGSWRLENPRSGEALEGRFFP
jgi:hypothetical protein